MDTGSILGAIEKLEAGTIAKRSEGLEDLRRALNSLQSSSRLQTVGDIGWQKILNVLFTLVKNDKHDLLNGSATAKKRATNRLEIVSSALRLVVTTCTPFIQSKLAHSVLDHISNQLDYERSTEEPFRQCVQAEFVKAYRVVLNNESHCEHLRASQWSKCVDLILCAINANLASLTGIDDDDNDDVMSIVRGVSINSSMRSTVAMRASQNSGNRGSRAQDSQIMDDLIISLRNLSSTPNSPLHLRSNDISQTVINTLTTSLQTKDAAFECLNNIVLVARTEDIDLVVHIAAQVLVIMKQLWTYKVDHKSISLREQMLVNVLLVLPCLRVGQLAKSRINLSSIDSLAKHMLEEYDSRTSQDCLQLSDLILTNSASDDFFSQRGISPKLDSPLAVLNWTTVSLIAKLKALSQHHESTKANDDIEGYRLPKRKRLSLAFPDVVRILFVEEQQIGLEEATHFLEHILPTLTDDREGRSSWLLLVLSRLCRCSIAAEEVLSIHWDRAWSVASQLITSTVNSRAACFAMMALLEAGLVDSRLSSTALMDSCFHGGSMGPPILTDAALLLFTFCLRSNFLPADRDFTNFHGRIMAWLNTTWIIPPARDYAGFVNISNMARPTLLLGLLAALNGKGSVLCQECRATYPTTIYNYYLRTATSSDLLDFCIGTVGSEERHIAHSHGAEVMQRSAPLMSKEVVQSLTDFLTRKLEEFRNGFREIEVTDCKDKDGKLLDHKRRANLSLDLAEIICNACAVASLIMDQNHLKGNLQIINSAWECVLDYTKLQFNDELGFQSTCTRFGQRLLSLRHENVTDSHEYTRRIHQLLSSLNVLIADQSSCQLNSDEMDLDFGTQVVGSQYSQSKSQNTDPHVMRRDIETPADIRSRFIETRIMLMRESLSTDNAKSAVLASSITELVVKLSSNHLLASRTALLDWIDHGGSPSTSDAYQLLHHVANCCLRDDKHERNEAALCFCLKVLYSTMHLWENTEHEKLGDVAFTVYSWFIEIALDKGIASTQVLHNLARVLAKLLHRQPQYGVDDLPSPRTSLLKILKIATSSLRFNMVPILEDLFDCYILTEHAAVFDDVVDCLPTDPEDREGIAVRLFVLAKLGSRWTTVLRQAVYHIFETAANVPSSLNASQKAVKIMTTNLRLGTQPTALFRLFASQLFFTWLQDGTIDTIPFTAFGFESLQHLISGECGELVPQLVLRTNPRNQQMVCNMLETGWRNLVLQNFPKSAAYAVSTDIVENRAGADIGPLEEALQAVVGQADYRTLFKRHFAQILTQVMLCLSDDKGLEKVLDSHEPYKSLFETYAAIYQRGASTVVLPQRQQPSFKAKYLMQILSKLCLRANLLPESFWNSALLVYLYRELLDDADPALGPLHVASMIRRIRIAVVLSGTIALQGYPLEMLLHSLRTYLTKFHCSQDTIGICWYLLEYGRGHLQNNLSFVSGFGVSAFASLAVFASSPQESTTQENHHHTTLGKADDFRSWLAGFLLSLVMETPETDRARRYRSMITSAKDITTSATNNKNEPEGMLIYHIILDQVAPEPLISAKSFINVLRMLSDHFQLTDDPTNDIFASSPDLLAGASVLQSIQDISQYSVTFQAWIGSVLGRAYSIQGPTLVSRRFGNTISTDRVKSNSLLPEDSYRRILHTLADVIFTGDSRAASVAERIMSFVLSHLSKTDRQSHLGGSPVYRGLQDLTFDTMQCPEPLLKEPLSHDADSLSALHDFGGSQHWAATVAESLISPDLDDPILIGLKAALRLCGDFASKILPCVVHLVLEWYLARQIKTARNTLTELFDNVLMNKSDGPKGFARLVLEVIFYLRSCTIHNESTYASRNHWLEIDYRKAAMAALQCQMPEWAILLAEIGRSEQDLQAGRTRRSSVADDSYDKELLSRLFRSVEDHDFFYASNDKQDMLSVMDKLEHELDGTKALAFQSALFDSSFKLHGMESALQYRSGGMTTALTLANLNGLAYVTHKYTNSSVAASTKSSGASMLNTHQWNVATADQDSQLKRTIGEVLSKVEISSSRAKIVALVEAGLQEAVSRLARTASVRHNDMHNLVEVAALSDIQRLVSATSKEDLRDVWTQFIQPLPWQNLESFDASSTILTTREAAAAAMRRNTKSSSLFNIGESELLLYEIQAVRSSLLVASKHDASQFCLNRAAYLNDLHGAATRLGLDTQAATTFDIANTLWSQGEIAAPIEMLRSLADAKSHDKGTLPVTRAELLTELGQKVSQARLNRPDEVTTHYLRPAIEALQKNTMGSMAGRVFHNFASFCDSQLQDSAAKDDYERVSEIRDRKSQEVLELTQMCQNASGTERKVLSGHLAKAKTWLKLDDEEYERLKANRAQLLQQSLENYLLSLRACDDFKKDALRLMALWLGNADVPEASKTVRDYLRFVPSMKLAPFVQQLCSRLLNQDDIFQKGLQDILLRIWCDHPFHGLYQLFSACKSKGAESDTVARSRNKSANILAEKVRTRGGTPSSVWVSLHNSAMHFVQFAQEKLAEKDTKAGSKIPFRNFKYGVKLEQTLQTSTYKIPPPTMSIALRADKDYSVVPAYTMFEPKVSIAGGVSAPKIVTMIATDGLKYKMLLKGGNDDLRQDVIMEQVFAQVSDLLQDHRPTRRRKLGIRTYKVIPLTHNTGIIEFVQNTMPLHDYLLPAHARYFPKDWKSNQCRRMIVDAAPKKLEERVKVYRSITQHFHPVMRFFFMENFLDPDEWFQKRLNYSRSTAAISMLGHVLGLGDRHGHNILLDQQSGEVVHIDLGVAFEAGRVLPVPEVVPFRLTRDLVDGMGISGVEGPFRRCCNFTLDALRKSQDAIMTILDVLRWDPLHNWSTSPLRLQRIQEQQEREEALVDGASLEGNAGTMEDGPTARGKVDEPGEADRALAVVAKKLSATLSVEATVNELIRQATDERNLAVLFGGWAAYV
ncbi:Serine/threonine-protein kinase tel1 [Lithohypha guttulata]|uniref:Serine/threonine-protein kinase Tel1 n=1 Tax=Lithohypha guttulata TaxID=1690604 RepID=A0AAN7T0W5_9EURO|nr:Serine/threonine-protein kinase tel1 [Lithohypha guttulata]